MFNGLTLIKKLNEILNELPNQVDKDLIKQVIENNVNISVEAFDISLIPVGLYSKRDISTHCCGVSKCFYTALEYLFLNYNGYDPYYQYDDKRFYPIYKNFVFGDIEIYKRDIELARCHIYRTCDKDIKGEVVDSLDLQITQLFIAKLLSYMPLYDFLNK